MKGLKTLRSVEPFIIESKDKKIKFCVNCGNVATHTAYFSVEGATIIERYCDACSKAIGEPSNAGQLDEK
jgi:hypothetical protein